MNTTDIMGALGSGLRGVWREKKYFPFIRPMTKACDLFVSAGLVVKTFGVNIKTVRNGISNFGLDKSKHWRSFVSWGTLMIDYESIPTNTKTNANLPDDSKEALELLRSRNKDWEEISASRETEILYTVLEDHYNNRWPPFQKYYETKISDVKEQILYAKSHAMIDYIRGCRDSKWPSREIFHVYQRFIRSQLDALEQPKLHTENVVYFWRVIRNCIRYGIAETLVHDSLGVTREYRVKVTGAIRAFIRLRQRQRTYTVSEIIKEVKKEYQVELAPSTVKRLKSNSEDRNVLEYDANGRKHSRQNGLPKITRFLAGAPGEQYQGDFYKLQFYCRSANGKVTRLWSYVVLDVFSKKVVGWALGEEQSATLAKDAFKMAFVDHFFLPEEIIIDNDVFYRRPVFKRLMRRLNNLGVITTKAFPNIPTWKAEIESFFAVFQKLHSSKPWYIGEDIQSKNLAGNPPKELVKEMYTKVSSMMSVPEMITEFGKMIEEYNYATNDRKKKVAPVDLFRMFDSKRTIKWEGWMEPLLFWNTMTKKRIKNDGRIDLQIERVEYCYQITKAEMLWKYKNSDVRMCYDPNDLSKIHIFERGTLKYIGEIEPRMVMTRDNKTEVMKKQRRILREAQRYIGEKRQEDEYAVNGIVGTSKRNESLADKIIKRQIKQSKFEREVSKIELVD